MVLTVKNQDTCYSFWALRATAHSALPVSKAPVIRVILCISLQGRRGSWNIQCSVLPRLPAAGTASFTLPRRKFVSRRAWRKFAGDRAPLTLGPFLECSKWLRGLPHSHKNTSGVGKRPGGQ